MVICTFLLFFYVEFPNDVYAVYCTKHPCEKYTKTRNITKGSKKIFLNGHLESVQKNSGMYKIVLNDLYPILSFDKLSLDNYNHLIEEFIKLGSRNFNFFLSSN